MCAVSGKHEDGRKGVDVGLSIETIISLVIAFGALLFTALSFRRTANQDTSATATERATMTADIKYIRTSVDDIKVDNRVIKENIGQLQTKVAKVEQAVESAHRRIDDLKGAK